MGVVEIDDVVVKCVIHGPETPSINRLKHFEESNNIGTTMSRIWKSVVGVGSKVKDSTR